MAYNTQGPAGPGGRGPGQEPPKPKGWDKRIGVFLFWLLLAWVAFSLIGRCSPAGMQISYDTFRTHVVEGRVAEVTVQGEEISGSLHSPATRTTAQNKTAEYQQFYTYLPSFGDDTLLQKLEDQGVTIETLPATDGDWLLYLIMWAPLLLIVALGYMQYKRMGGKAQSIFNVGKSKAKLFDKSSSDVDMDDVAGASGAKTELKEIIQFLKNPERIRRLGAETPTGVLLVGPPGTGKTLLARAVAGEADAPFYHISGSDFMEMFVGVGASRVRDLFKEAKKNAPAIIFIDELDSIGRLRGAGLGGGHDEREQTLNQILSEMDGFEPNESVIVMSATNRPDILDPALTRPGRFDRRIVVELPSTHDRRQILDIYAKDKPMADDVDLDRLARGTPGFSGADLENLLNEAALLAARHEREEVTQEDIEQARDKVLMGLERTGLMLTDDEKRMVAYHESGHAIVAAKLTRTDPIHKVSIIPRSRSMGVTQQLPEKDKYVYRKEYMLDRLAVMMGGRAAEMAVFDTATSGAGNDLQEATALARKMVLEWGMGDTFRNMAPGGQQQQVFLGEEIAHKRDYSEETAREIDQEVRQILAQSYERAEEAIQGSREKLDELADALLEHEELSGERVLAILGIASEDAQAASHTQTKE